MMAGQIKPEHTPAVKVGGRRLSLSTPRAKPAATVNHAQSPAPDVEEPLDYPRPVAPTAESLSHHETPKNTGYKTIGAEHAKKPDEPHKKVDDIRPKHEHIEPRKAVGGAGKIAQPGGKVLGST
ncbi:hypothetical protein SISNIDRAFT_79625 [Sistotremastrum niveocremeum HHB9708]|uniref:Uncharacterized protein n=1 Tax=Sistotremastrum niveocremeum HHB9708 TaxID=1314777 RepID=A0A164UM04_9AGAM|nr:hypothetical protein SISNIDRAFT_79625 [Sistotremastrum niveocremeum HHB9708]